MDAISQLLDEMGSTPDLVAVALRGAQVQGLRDSTSFMNPIVRYLNRDLDIGGKLEIGVGGTVVRLQLDGRLREVALPLAMQVFLDGSTAGSSATWNAAEAQATRTADARTRAS